MATPYINRLRGFSRDVRLFLVTSALTGFCFMGVYLVLFNLYLVRLGYGLEFIGLVNAAGLLVNAFGCVLAGVVGRRWGTRRSMIAGIGVMSLGLTLAPLAEFTTAGMRDAALLVTYSLGWMGMALYNVNMDVYLTAATSQEERGHAFSVMLAIWSLAGFVGSLLGGIMPGLVSGVLGVSLDDPSPYRYPLLLAAVLFAGGIPALLCAQDVGAHESADDAGEAGPAPYVLVGVLVVVQILQAAGEIAPRIFFNVYLDTALLVPASVIGTLAAVAQIVSVPAALATPLLISRCGSGRTFLRSSLLLALSVLPLALIPHWLGAGLGFMGVMALAMVWRAPFVMYRMDRVHPSWRTLMNGATVMALGLSGALVSFGGGRLVEGVGYRNVFLISAGMTVAGIAVFWLYDRRRQGGEDR